MDIEKVVSYLVGIGALIVFIGFVAYVFGRFLGW